MAGFFLTVEGIEGAGKTTIARRIVDWATEQNRPCLYLREPGSTRAGEEIRSILLNKEIELCLESELLLFEAARIQLMDEVILPALYDNKIVVLDRFIDSTTAYQGYGRGLNLEWVNRLNEFSCRNRFPDLTVLLDIDVQTGLQRARKVSAHEDRTDRFESEAVEFMERVRDGFLKITETDSNRFHLVEVKGREDEVWLNVLEIVQQQILKD